MRRASVMEYTASAVPTELGTPQDAVPRVKLGSAYPRELGFRGE
jgi:hypothetical protein